MIGRTPRRGRHAGEPGLRPRRQRRRAEAVRDLEVEHGEQVTGRDRRVAQEPARLVGGIVRRAVGVGEVIRPDREARGSCARPVRRVRRVGGQRPGAGPEEREAGAGAGDPRPVDRSLVVAHVDAAQALRGRRGRRGRGRGRRGRRRGGGGGRGRARCRRRGRGRERRRAWRRARDRGGRRLRLRLRVGRRGRHEQEHDEADRNERTQEPLHLRAMLLPDRRTRQIGANRSV